MATLKFTKDHEWIRVEGDEAVVGITDYAQKQLGDVVFVELPEIGRQVEQGRDAAVVESVKAASEVYAPVDGTVLAVNDALADEPATVNTDAQGGGWFFRLKLAKPAQIEALMDEAAYAAFTASLA